MSGTSPLGTPYPTLGDAPNVPADMQAAVTSLDLKSVPLFASTAARNTAFALSAFQVCIIAGVMYMRRGSAWVSMLADPDINTGWLAPTMASGWSSLTADPLRYRITSGKVQWKGVAFNSTGVPGTSSVCSVPSNALPSNASGWENYNYAEACVATPLSGATPNVMGFINLRGSGTLVCILNGSFAAGATKVSFYSQGWYL